MSQNLPRKLQDHTWMSSLHRGWCLVVCIQTVYSKYGEWKHWNTFVINWSQITQDMYLPQRCHIQGCGFIFLWEFELCHESNFMWIFPMKIQNSAFIISRNSWKTFLSSATTFILIRPCFYVSILCVLLSLSFIIENTVYFTVYFMTHKYLFFSHVTFV